MILGRHLSFIFCRFRVDRNSVRTFWPLALARVISKGRKSFGTLLCKLFVTLCVLLSISAIQATDIQQNQFISDEEIEQTLTNWLSQIFKVAKIATQPKVLILSSSEVNAGATLGGIIIVYTGLILKCQNVNQLLGVLAHETGHIAGAHSARAAEAQNQALVPAVATMLLSGAAALATGSSEALMAGLMGGTQIFERGLLKHSRDQEEAADSAALTYLTELKWPITGLSEFLNLLDTNNYTGRIDPYTSTHPLSNDRREKVKLFEKAASSKVKLVEKESSSTVQALPEEEIKFQRIKAKINSFMSKPEAVLRDYKVDDKSIAARYGRVIALYRTGKRSEEALKLLEELIVENPSDPFFLELKGQILFETGKVSEATKYFRQALEFLPKAQTIKILLAQALLEGLTLSQEDPKINKEDLKDAISLLNQVVGHSPESVFAWHLLARAYGEDGQMNHVALCLAEEAFLVNNLPMAKAQATKARTTKAKGNNDDPIVIKRANDILKQIEFGEGKKP